VYIGAAGVARVARLRIARGRRDQRAAKARLTLALSGVVKGPSPLNQHFLRHRTPRVRRRGREMTRGSTGLRELQMRSIGNSARFQNSSDPGHVDCAVETWMVIFLALRAWAMGGPRRR